MTTRSGLRLGLGFGVLLLGAAGAGTAGAQDLPRAGEGPESLRLRLTNAPGGVLEASRDGGVHWLLLGRVVHPAAKVSRAGFTASSWARDSAVAATAVNAIHFRITRDPATGRAIIFSLVPAGPVVGSAVREASSAITTDIPGGAGPFGGGLGPYVNSPVYLQQGGKCVPLPPDYVPAAGDVLLIIRHDPPRLPRYAVFENTAGGAITLDYGDGPPVRVGRVDRPVTGVGRFEGGVHAAPGRIRANHPGVIDVTTAPHGLMGGFQIIPRRHALSPEMISPQGAGQWMIIGPDDLKAEDWAGEPPFFSGYLLPSYRPDDISGNHADWMGRVLSRCQVQARFGDGPWELLPRIAFTARGRPDTAERSRRGRHGLWLIPAQTNPGLPMSPSEKAEADQALTGITALRIVFPWQHFWPEGTP